MWFKRRIRLIEPASYPHPARHRVDLSDDVAIVCQNQVGPNHARQIVPNFFAPRKFNQLARFTGIEITRDPFRLLSFNAELIKLIARALKDEQPMAKLLQLGQKSLVNREWVGGKQPILLGEETLLGKSGADCRQPVVLNEH